MRGAWRAPSNPATPREFLRARGPRSWQPASPRPVGRTPRGAGKEDGCGPCPGAGHLSRPPSACEGWPSGEGSGEFAAAAFSRPLRLLDTAASSSSSGSPPLRPASQGGSDLPLPSPPFSSHPRSLVNFPELTLSLWLPGCGSSSSGTGTSHPRGATTRPARQGEAERRDRPRPVAVPGGGSVGPGPAAPLPTPAAASPLRGISPSSPRQRPAALRAAVAAALRETRRAGISAAPSDAEMPSSARLAGGGGCPAPPGRGCAPWRFLRAAGGEAVPAEGRVAYPYRGAFRLCRGSKVLRVGGKRFRVRGTVRVLG